MTAVAASVFPELISSMDPLSFGEVSGCKGLEGARVWVGVEAIVAVGVGCSVGLVEGLADDVSVSKLVSTVKVTV
jgi:hypothetical protein